MLDDTEAAIKAGQITGPSEGLKKIMARLPSCEAKTRFERGLMPVSEAIHDATCFLFAPLDMVWPRYRPIKPCECGQEGCLTVKREVGGVLSADRLARMDLMTKEILGKLPPPEHVCTFGLLTRTATWKCTDKKIKIKALLVKATVLDHTFHREYLI